MIAQLPSRFKAQSKVFETYKQVELSDRQTHDLVIQMLDSKAINVTEIPHLLKEWRTPRHLEFAGNGRTAWRLFNAVTETIKGDLWRFGGLRGRISNRHKTAVA